MATPYEWKIVYSHFKPEQERLREALCTLANGYFGARGCMPECHASRNHYPGTYLAGLYNRLKTRVAGKIIENEDFVNCPNWLFLTFRGGTSEWFTPASDNLISFHQELDMYRGLLLRKIIWEDSQNKKTLIETTFMVSQADPHIGAIRYVITPKNYSNWITVRSLLDGAVINQGVERYKKLSSKHWRPFSAGTFAKNGIYLSMRTTQSRILLSQASKLSIFSEGAPLHPQVKTSIRSREQIGQDFKIFVHRNKSYVIEKIVSLYSSKDKEIRHPQQEAVKRVRGAPDFDALAQAHQNVWRQLWDKTDIQIEGDTFSQKIVRLHIFHLLQTASIHNTKIDAGLPARGLHGEAYRGHVFWDEMFARPFYDLHIPEITRALLLYRYRRLPAARRYARSHGFRGAMFPWQSGSSGREETQVIHLNPMSGKWGPDYSSRQRHVNFAIAYDVWKHYSSSGDLDFLVRYGAEIFLSIAQFCASLIRFDPADRRFHTQGIMGPDEFHEKLPSARTAGLKDNAYSNLMISWILIKAGQVLKLLSPEAKQKLLRKLGLRETAVHHWQEMARKMKVIFNDKGVMSQFDGYFKLKEINWERYRAKYRNIHRMDRILKAEGLSPDEYKVSKQADALMVFYLFPFSEAVEIFKGLGYHFDKERLKKNYEYYIKRTSHGSSLSKVVHCLLAHKLGFYQEGWDLFIGVLESDFYDTQGGTTPEGVHIGVMGGSISIVRRGFAGIEFLKDRIRILPRLPKSWHKIRLKFAYWGRWVLLSVSKTQITLFVYGLEGKSFETPVEINGKLHNLILGKTYKFPLK